MSQVPVDPTGGPIAPKATLGGAVGGGVATLSGTDVQHFVFWGVGAAALLILADYAPKAAIALTGLIGLGVVLKFSTQLQSAISNLTKTATGAQASDESSGNHGSNSSGTGGSNVTQFPRSPFIRSLVVRQGGIAG